MTPTEANLIDKYQPDTGDDSLINPVSMTPRNSSASTGHNPVT
jgi:hypothetical protein